MIEIKLNSLEEVLEWNEKLKGKFLVGGSEGLNYDSHLLLVMASKENLIEAFPELENLIQ
jgi:hypothetical protein